MSKRNRPRSVRSTRGAGSHPTMNPPLQFTKSGSFVPARTRVSLRWTYAFTTTASTSFVSQAFGGNVVADPGLATTSTQPVGFDYWALMYGKYRCIGSQIVVRAALTTTNVLASRSGNFTFAVYPSNYATSLTALADAMSQPLVKFAEVTAQASKSIRCVGKTSALSGWRGIESVDAFAAEVTTTPALPWFWNVAYASDAAYTDQNTAFDIQITYDVEFFERVNINRSTLVSEYIRLAYLEHCKELIAARKTFEQNRKSWGLLQEPDVTSVNVGQRTEKKIISTSEPDSPVLVSGTVNPTPKSGAPSRSSGGVGQHQLSLGGESFRVVPPKLRV